MLDTELPFILSIEHLVFSSTKFSITVWTLANTLTFLRCSLTYSFKITHSLIHFNMQTHTYTWNLPHLEDTMLSLKGLVGFWQMCIKPLKHFHVWNGNPRAVCFERPVVFAYPITQWIDGIINRSLITKLLVASMQLVKKTTTSQLEMIFHFYCIMYDCVFCNNTEVLQGWSYFIVKLKS